MTDILLIDNYDSFTWNLVHLVGALGPRIDVRRNDEVSVDEIARLDPDAIVISPGPCTPNEAGICLDLIGKLGSRIPMFGVCLGMQAMGQSYGGKVVRAPLPMHGKVSQVRHDGRSLFKGINGPFEATRYHSLIVERATCPDVLEQTAWTEDGLMMAMSHRTHPVHGVQFHPESILSEHGGTIVKNFLDLAATWNKTARDRAFA